MSTDTTMLAFRGTEVTRDQLIASLEAHRAADRIKQGAYWRGDGDGRGCAVGCTIHDFRPGHEDSHGLYETLFGVPESLARLEDGVFEGLPEADARDWPLQFARAIREGADLSRVTPAVLYRIVERRRDALADLDLPDDLRATIVEAMEGVLDVLRQWRDTGEVDESAAWSAARSVASARSAAWSAAACTESGAWSAAWSAARSAWSATRSAASAARSAESAWSAWGAARSAASAASAASAEHRWIADVLIEEIKRAPVEVSR